MREREGRERGQREREEREKREERGEREERTERRERRERWAGNGLRVRYINKYIYKIISHQSISSS